MRLPRDLSGQDLAKKLEKAFGYLSTRQTGSHLRLTTQTNGQHHVTIPMHDQLRLGTLSVILLEVAEHLQISKEVVLKRICEI